MSNFIQDLQRLLNRCNEENESDTPNFILARYLQNCLNAFNKATNDRDWWYAEKKREVRKEERR